MTADPTDFIVELTKPRKGQRGFPDRIVYRLKQWKRDIKRYEFIKDYLVQAELNTKLIELGIENPEQVSIVDLLEG